MADASDVKQYFKDASDEEAKRMYDWAKTAMEVRGIVAIPQTGRKRRSDAGITRTPKVDDISVREGQTGLNLEGR